MHIESKSRLQLTFNHSQRDFDLVISNAKTYNPPGTIYFREAEKIGDYGTKMILRESHNVGNTSEVEEEEEIDIVDTNARKQSLRTVTPAKAPAETQGRGFRY